jgi:hypothetical protein
MLLGACYPVQTSANSSSIAVASTATVYTKAFKLYPGVYFGLWVGASSATGTPDVKIELEESWSLPTVEGAAETTLWVEPDGFDDIFSQINDEVAHIKTISPIPMAYGRYKITGINANPADTIVTMYNFMQEEV